MMKLQYFNINEFDSPDAPGSGKYMQVSTLEKLECARDLANIPFIITSGYRTYKHNRRVGGVSGSAHTKGRAVDIRCHNSFQRLKIVAAALEAGFNRIGVSKSFVHLDDDPDKPQNVLWTY